MNLKALALLSITTPLFVSFAQANQDNVSLVCHAAADSYWSGPSFDLTFVNDLSKIEYVNACFATCRKDQKAPKKMACPRRYGVWHENSIQPKSCYTKRQPVL